MTFLLPLALVALLAAPLIYLIHLLHGRLSADVAGGITGGGEGGRADVGNQVGDVRESGIGRIEIRLGNLRIGFGLCFQFNEPLNGLSALGGGWIFAWQSDAVPCADLGLQSL